MQKNRVIEKMKKRRREELTDDEIKEVITLLHETFCKKKEQIKCHTLTTKKLLDE